MRPFRASVTDARSMRQRAARLLLGCCCWRGIIARMRLSGPVGSKLTNCLGGRRRSCTRPAHRCWSLCLVTLGGRAGVLPGLWVWLRLVAVVVHFHFHERASGESEREGLRAAEYSIGNCCVCVCVRKSLPDRHRNSIMPTTAPVVSDAELSF